MKNKVIWKINRENKYIMATFMMSVIVSYAFTNHAVSIGLAVIETLVLLHRMVTRRTGEFIILYLFFSSVSMESNLFTLGARDETIYSFFNLPYLSLYLLFFMVVLMYIYTIYKDRSFKINLRSLSGKAVLLFAIAALVTLFTVLLDDNGVASTDGLTRYVIIDMYNSLWMVFLFALIWDQMKKDNGFIWELEDLIRGILCGLSLAGLLLALTGNVYYVSARASNLVVPLMLFFSPGLVLFFFREKGGVKYLVIGLVSFVVQIKYSVGIPGAWLLYVAVVFAVFLYRLFRELWNKKLFKRIFLMMCLLCGAFCVFVILNPGFFANGIDPNKSYISWKLYTLSRMFTFSGGMRNWYAYLGDSIGIRVDAIVNCLYEIVKKPWFALFGKGFGGTITKNWGIYNWNIYGSSYPDVQIKAGVYSSFHTGIAELIINFGIVGIAGMVLLVKRCITGIFGEKFNPWIVIGTLWFLIIFYFYHSMFLGLAILGIGIYAGNGKHDRRGDFE